MKIYRWFSLLIFSLSTVTSFAQLSEELVCESVYYDHVNGYLNFSQLAVSSVPFGQVAQSYTVFSSDPSLTLRHEDGTLFQLEHSSDLTPQGTVNANHNCYPTYNAASRTLFFPLITIEILDWTHLLPSDLYSSYGLDLCYQAGFYQPTDSLGSPFPGAFILYHVNEVPCAF